MQRGIDRDDTGTGGDKSLKSWSRLSKLCPRILKRFSPKDPPPAPPVGVPPVSHADLATSAGLPLSFKSPTGSHDAGISPTAVSTNREIEARSLVQTVRTAC